MCKLLLLNAGPPGPLLRFPMQDYSSCPCSMDCAILAQHTPISTLLTFAMLFPWKQFLLLLLPIACQNYSHSSKLFLNTFMLSYQNRMPFYSVYDFSTYLQQLSRFDRIEAEAVRLLWVQGQPRLATGQFGLQSKTQAQSPHLLYFSFPFMLMLKDASDISFWPVYPRMPLREHGPYGSWSHCHAWKIMLSFSLVYYLFHS